MTRRSRALLRTLCSVSPGALLLAACGADATRGERAAATRAEALVAEPELYTGSGLGPKELILTFDDGPGPMEVTGALSTWLRSRPTPIHATFFVNGSCIAPTQLPSPGCSPRPGAAAVLAQIVADGHLLANHTTTHRSLATEVPAAERVAELAETDALIAPHVPWDRFFFRAPYGDWTAEAHAALAASAMGKYIGPIYWAIGGGPTTTARAADWECWDRGLTTRQCGDLYLAEARAVGRGIVLLHDPHGNTDNHALDSGTGNTADMVKYIVPVLEAEGFTFKPLSHDPMIAAALPSCDAACVTCSGPGPDECTDACGDCDDGDPCTADTCDPRSGCSHAPIAGCEPDAPDDPGPPDPGSAEDEDEEREEPASQELLATDGGGCAAGGAKTAGRPWLALVGLTLFLRRRRRGKDPSPGSSVDHASGSSDAAPAPGSPETCGLSR